MVDLKGWPILGIRETQLIETYTNFYHIALMSGVILCENVYEKFEGL